MNERLIKQLEFIIEVDKIKNIYRRSLIADGSRYENDAEHSWHLALMAWIMIEYSPVNIDLLHVMKMVIIHDIVEIDAGDTFAYDVQGHFDKREREELASKRIFGLLPHDQTQGLRALWEEFEAMETPEAKFAAALDRMQPILLNYLNDGASWKKHNICAEQVLERNKHIQYGAPELWEYVIGIINDAIDKGMLSSTKLVK